MKFDFIGTGIKIIGYNGRNKGLAKITIDNDEEVYDFYTSNESPKALLYTKSGLKFGKHSLRIDVLAQNRIFSNNSYVYIDAIDVLNADNKELPSDNNEQYIVSASSIVNNTNQLNQGTKINTQNFVGTEKFWVLICITLI